MRRVPREIYAAATHLNLPALPLLTRQFLYTKTHPDAAVPASHLPPDDLPEIQGSFYTYNSARAVFYAPSDLSGLGGLHHERIRSVKSWYGGLPRHDCVFVGKAGHEDEPGFRSLLVARVFLFFSFTHLGTRHECALVHWFSTVGDLPCEETGMWIVEPDYRSGKPVLAVIDLDTVLRGAHLIGNAGKHFIPPYDPRFNFSTSLDTFKTFYVNKYVDYHAHEVAF